MLHLHNIYFIIEGFVFWPTSPFRLPVYHYLWQSLIFIYVHILFVAWFGFQISYLSEIICYWSFYVWFMRSRSIHISTRARAPSYFFNQTSLWFHCKANIFNLLPCLMSLMSHITFFNSVYPLINYYMHKFLSFNLHTRVVKSTTFLVYLPLQLDLFFNMFSCYKTVPLLFRLNK